MAERGRDVADRLLIGAVSALLLLPVVAVVVSALATDWYSGLVPAGLTLRWFAQVLNEKAFQSALARSLFIAAGSVALQLLVSVPAILAAHCYLPWLDRWMERLMVLPYALPQVVLVVGLLGIYASDPVVLIGTPWILLLGYLPLAFPLLYLPLKNNLRALPVHELLDAGHLVGAGDLVIARRVLLPCVAPGLVVGLSMVFALGFAEFVFANMLVGGNFQTLAIYLFGQRQKVGQVTAVIVVIYFAAMWLS
ncbi:MAG TPA: ABC transporter permease subunit, partial [Acetobacteraceae bacterium]|nr:ABC transporter permease subunit [Acetobacteraceae bacterium]